MLIRKIILGMMLAALALCALGGVAAVFASRTRELWAVVAIAIIVAIALGVMLPLTLLLERPKYRAGGFAAMATLGLAATALCGMLISELLRLHMWELESVLGATVAMTFLYGVPTTGALLLVQFKWARVAPWVMAGTAITALAFSGLAGVMALIGDSRIVGSFMGTGLLTFLVGFLSSLLLVNVGQGDWRLFRFPAIGLAILAFLIFMPPAWENVVGFRVDDDLWAKGGAILLLPVVFCAHLNLLLMARVTGMGVWIRVLTIAGSLVTMLLIAVAIVTEVELVAGVAAAGGIATASGSLATIVVALLQRRVDRSQETLADVSMLKEIDIGCPRCKKRQTLPLGETACAGCGLKLLLQAIEPRCRQCGYLLYGTESNRCSECGALQTENAVPAPLPAAPAAVS